MDLDQTRTLVIPAVPTLVLPLRLLIRRDIESGLPTDSELDGFCLDSFPAIHRQFTSEMSRPRRINLLIEKVDAPELAQALYHYLRAKHHTAIPTAKRVLPGKHRKKKHGMVLRSVQLLRRFKDLLLGGLLVAPLRRSLDWLQEVWMSIASSISTLLAAMSKSVTLSGALSLVGSGVLITASNDNGQLARDPAYFVIPSQAERKARRHVPITKPRTGPLPQDTFMDTYIIPGAYVLSSILQLRKSGIELTPMEPLADTSSPDIGVNGPLKPNPSIQKERVKHAPPKKRLSWSSRSHGSLSPVPLLPDLPAHRGQPNRPQSPVRPGPRGTDRPSHSTRSR